MMVEWVDKSGTILLVLIGILIIFVAIGYAIYDESKEMAKIPYIKAAVIENFTGHKIRTEITPTKKINKDSGYEFIESDVCVAPGGGMPCEWSIFSYNDIYETKEKIKVAVENRLKRGVNPFPSEIEETKLCRNMTISVVGVVKWDKRERDELNIKYPKYSSYELPNQKKGKNIVLFIEKIIGNPQPCLAE